MRQFFQVHQDAFPLAQGVGANPAATHAVIHAPKAPLHARMAGGAPRPPVTVPNVTPAAA